uniref:Cilia-and flagella-associated protein 96 n=2 Tax=Pygocentrus nattereri TaxID=42514 RepID=A0A3B4D2M2_PYGNA
MPPEGKSDMERVGLFKEMGYISIGDKYTSLIYRPFNESAQKNKQMLCGGPKKKSALQAGYFDTQFKRIYEKEALTDLVKIQRQYKIQQAKKNLGKAFLPSSGEKKPSGIGSYYGTLGGPIQALSPLQIPKKPYKSPGKNMYTSPPKKGSGYGYPGVTLSKLDLYSSDPYDRAKEMIKREIVAHKSMLKGGPFRLNLHPKECFDSNPYKLEKHLPPSKNTEDKKTHFAVPFKPSSPSKRIGGMKAGTFDTYPSHSADPYITRKPKSVTMNKEGKIFHPSPGAKSTPVKSIIALNVNKFVNFTNYNQVSSVMTY